MHRCSMLISRLSFITLLYLVLSPFSNAAIAQQKSLILTTEDYPSFNIVDPETRKINGISTEKVTEIMRRAGVAISIQAYPWARSYLMAQRDTDTCVFSTTRTPQREALFKWVGPLVKNNWVIFGRADDTRKPKNIDDLRGYIIGVYRQGAVSEFFSYNGIQIDIANYDEENPRKLMYKRFDFWATGEKLGNRLIKAKGYTGKIVPLFQFNQVELYLACNPLTAQSNIDLYNKILRDMEKDGTVSAIERKYQYQSQ
ncbi:polar amino acid transport system substrate-binding protein [Undibacterium sp. GrIS 1.8]|uniref:substrate-binding periplasmic protein n=1 Tax=Undibacterium sp. GrIS 1.8 TaxID=3143934 RepID=UPI00339261E0